MGSKLLNQLNTMTKQGIGDTVKQDIYTNSRSLSGSMKSQGIKITQILQRKVSGTIESKRDRVNLYGRIPIHPFAEESFSTLICNVNVTSTAKSIFTAYNISSLYVNEV